MKTIERARVIRDNCHAVLGGRYNILYDLHYRRFRVLRASRGIPDGMSMREAWKE